MIHSTNTYLISLGDGWWYRKYHRMASRTQQWNATNSVITLVFPVATVMTLLTNNTQSQDIHVLVMQWVLYKGRFIVGMICLESKPFHIYKHSLAYISPIACFIAYKLQTGSTRWRSVSRVAIIGKMNTCKVVCHHWYVYLPRSYSQLEISYWTTSGDRPGACGEACQWIWRQSRAQCTCQQTRYTDPIVSCQHSPVGNDFWELTCTWRQSYVVFAVLCVKVSNWSTTFDTGWHEWIGWKLKRWSSRLEWFLHQQNWIRPFCKHSPISL